MKRKNKWIFRFVMAIIAVFSFMGANAQSVNLGELELGKEYELTAYKPCEATFTAPQTGTLVASCTRSYWPEPYLDAEHTKPVGYKHSYVSTGSIWEFQVEEGVTYYFYSGFLFDDGTFSIDYAATELLRKSVNPAEGSTLNVSGAGQVNLEYNMTVSVSDIALTIDGEDYGKGVPYVSGRNVAISFKGETEEELDILGLLKNGTLKGGETVEFAFTVTSINNPSLTLNEKLTYICPEMLVQMVSSQQIPEFLSYWFPGDESGIMKLVFDGQLAQPAENEEGPFVTLQYGNPESGVDGDSYATRLDAQVDGNTVIVDFTGKRLRPADMLTSGNIYNTMLVKISNVKDYEGRYVYTGFSGSLGSFSYEFPYRIVETEAVYEFTPASETELKVSEVELWIQDYSSIRFDGVAYTYTDAEGNEVTEVKSLSELNPEVDSYGDAIIMIPVREEIRTKENLKISLANLLFVDGVEREISAVYNPIDEYLSISGATTDAVSETARFGVEGSKLASPRKGVNIIRLSDGTVKKVLVK